MNKLEEIYKYLEVAGHTKGEPEFVQIKTPVTAEEGWFIELIWDHHDGQIPDASFTAPTFDEVCDKMFQYIVDRDSRESEDTPEPEVSAPVSYNSPVDTNPATKQSIDFDTWFNQLQDLGILHGHAVTDDSKVFWHDYYEDGDTPVFALEDDIRASR